MAVGGVSAAHGVVIVAERMTAEHAITITAFVVFAGLAFTDIIFAVDDIAPCVVMLHILCGTIDVAVCLAVDAAAEAILRGTIAEYDGFGVFIANLSDGLSVFFDAFVLIGSRQTRRAIDAFTSPIHALFIIATAGGHDLTFIIAINHAALVIAVILKVFTAFVDAAFAFDACLIVVTGNELIFVAVLANEGVGRSLACRRCFGFVAFDALTIEAYRRACQACAQFLNETAVAPERGFAVCFALRAVCRRIAFGFHTAAIETERFIVGACCLCDNGIFTRDQRVGGIADRRERIGGTFFARCGIAHANAVRAMRVFGAVFLIDFAVFANGDEQVAFAGRRIGSGIAGRCHAFTVLTRTIATSDEGNFAVCANGRVLVIHALRFECRRIAVSAFDDVIEASARIAALIAATSCFDDIAVFARDNFVADAFGGFGFVAFFRIGNFDAVTRDTAFIGNVAIASMPSAVLALTGNRAVHAGDFAGRAIRGEILADAAFADIAVVACSESLEAVFTTNLDRGRIDADWFECLWRTRTIGDTSAVIAFGAVLACFQNDLAIDITLFGFAIFAYRHECFGFTFNRRLAFAIDTGLSAETWGRLDNAIFTVQARKAVIGAAFVIGFALPGANTGITCGVAFARKIGHCAIIAYRIGHAVAAERNKCRGIASGRRHAEAVATYIVGLAAFPHNRTGNAFGQRVIVAACRPIVRVAIQHIDITANVEFGVANIAGIADMSLDITNGAVALIGCA